MAYHRTLTKTLAAALLACTAADAADRRDPAEVLQRVIAKVVARDATLPNYTCVETVERDYFKPMASTLPRSCSVLMELRKNRTPDMKLKWILTDRLRLDVAMTKRGEINSWVGASRFEDVNIDQVVRNGPIGTGSFGGYVALVFFQAAGSIRFERTVESDGRELMEYSFLRPKEHSAYRVKVGNDFIPTGYAGTFQVNPETAELVRLSMQSLDMPEGSENCNTITNMEFTPVRIGDGEFLLPKQANQRFITVTGDEAENRTTFASCREYVGESTVTFLADSESAPAGAPARSAALPPNPVQAGLPFTFELTSPIAPFAAAAGDHVVGRLSAALKDDRGNTIAPAHAVVEGRLLRMQIIQAPPGGALLVLKLNSVTVKGVKIPLAAVREVERQTMTTRKMAIQLPLPWERNAGVFALPANHTTLEAGFKSKWVTAREK
jgi:hypothetical protein